MLGWNCSRKRSFTYSILLSEQSKIASFRFVITGAFAPFSSSFSFNSAREASLN